MALGPLRSNYLHKAKRLGYGPLADELGVSKGVLWKFCNTDYIPMDPEIRRKLNISEPEFIPQYRNPLGRFEKR